MHLGNELIEPAKVPEVEENIEIAVILVSVEIGDVIAVVSPGDV